MMSEPNDSEVNLDNAEDACKSDYFSDEGEVKNDLASPENGTSGKRKPVDIGFDDVKKVKISENEASTTDKNIKSLADVTLNNDFKRASSVASDNSDEFVDASDVLESTPAGEKKPTTLTDDVDACAVKNLPSSDIPKPAPESEAPKAKGRLISRLPTFADDRLDRFSSSAIRRGFFKEAEPAKPIDFNFDLNSGDKNDARNENKIVRKVKLNRSKFFSTDKPKFSDDSSSDSNSKFNNSTSPVKLDSASSNDKVIQSVKVDNKVAPLSIEEKLPVVNEPPVAVSSVAEITQTESKSSLKLEPSVNENRNSVVESTSIIPSLSCSSEEKIIDTIPQDKIISQIEAENAGIPQVNDAVSEPSEILDSNVDNVKTDELALKVDESMEQSDIESISNIDDIIDQKINELPIRDTEPSPVQEMETESQIVSSEAHSQLVESIEPEPELDLESQVIESIGLEVEPKLESQLVESIEPELESRLVKSIEPELESRLLESIEPESESQLVESIEPESESQLIESIEPEPESQLIASIEPEPASQSVESIEPEPESQLVESVEPEPESQLVESIEPESESHLVESIEPEPASRLVESVALESAPQLVESVKPQPDSQLVESTEPELKQQFVDSLKPEPQLIESVEPELESQLAESMELEPEPETIASESPQIEPQPVQPIESLSLSIEPPSEPVQPPEVQSIASPVPELNENKIFKEANDQVEKLDDGLLSLENDSSQLTPTEPEQTPIVSESIVPQVPILESDPLLEVPESNSIPTGILLDTKEDTCPDSKSVQDSVVSETTASLAISETIVDPVVSETPAKSKALPEVKPQSHTDSGVKAQAVDLDITTESEDIADDKTEPEVSNEESEGEIEEEEEEEIHEEELYLEDRIPPISKPKGPTPPPEPVPSPPRQKDTNDVILIDDNDEKDIQSSTKLAPSSPPVKQVEVTSSVENIEKIPTEKSLQSVSLMEDIEDSLVQHLIQPTVSIERIEPPIQRTPPLGNIENIPMDIDEEPEPVTAPPLPKELSKLEQALIGRPGIKRLEIQVPLEELPAQFEGLNERVTSTENEETKEKIKLHLSLQGDKVSIKKAPTTVVTSTGEVRVKRQYRKRNKDGNLKPDKTYKLRNRNSKKDEAAASEKDQSNKSVAAAGTDKPVDLDANTSRKQERIYSAEPIVIDSDDSSKSAPTKVQPIKLKITKNSNVTIECGPSFSELERTRDVAEDTRKKTAAEDKRKKVVEDMRKKGVAEDTRKKVVAEDTRKKVVAEDTRKKVVVEDTRKKVVTEDIRKKVVTEDTRKKDPVPNLMEQAATAWSGPDLQRVERLLKESNITITPVIAKEPPQSSPHSILKPMLVAAKEKPSTTSKFSTPSVASNLSSLQSATASITPISRDKYDSSSSEHTSPQRSEHHNGDAGDHHRFKDCFETPPSAIDKQIDIKSEIRKMLASDKRKADPRDSTDFESDSSDSKPKLKAVPDLVPINIPTSEMLQTLASSLSTNSSSEGDPLADKSKPEIDPAFLPLLQTFPKRRGRPTKAMVAAREALKQSQEAALENLKQFATQKASEGQPLPIPILDINDPEDLFKRNLSTNNSNITELNENQVQMTKRGRKSRSDRMDKSSDAEQSASETTVDPEREAVEIKRLEEERIKKEEEKERRNEIRRQKARERNDIVKAKRLRQKMKAEERQKRMQEKRRKLQEEKKKLEEEIKNLPTTLPGFDDETRMSTENSQSQMVSFSNGVADEDSSNATTELSQRVKKSRMEVTDVDSKDLTVDQIAEYQWPIQGGDLYMIQEQISNYLGVKSFKRKYPDIKRRPVDSEERAYLVDSGLVSETLCDLGLTAVSSAEVLDVMCADFPDKYEELRKHMRDKQMKELSFKQKAWANGLGYKLLMADGTKQDLKKRAMESASNWNSALNKSRSDDRRCAIDLQTFIVHYPKTRTRKMTIPTPKMGSYPVSILPGQFCDFYKTYTTTELRYMPLNTVMYGPLKPHATVPGDGSQTDSDDSSSSDESSTSSEGTQATEDTIEDTDKDMSVDESSILDKSHDLTLLKEQMTMELSENTRELIIDETAKILCKVCLGNITRNKENVPEVLIYCSQCSSTSHPSCLDLSLDMVPHIKKYAWQCPDCKICARCKENADEDKMLFCDTCDRGYHIYCVGLKKVPSGRWQCQECTTVGNCINNTTPMREVFKEPGLIDIHDG